MSELVLEETSDFQAGEVGRESHPGVLEEEEELGGRETSSSCVEDVSAHNVIVLRNIGIKDRSSSQFSQ